MDLIKFGIRVPMLILITPLFLFIAFAETLNWAFHDERYLFTADYLRWWKIR